MLNEQGKMIGEVIAATYAEELGLFYANGKYYDLDLKVVFDTEDIQYTLVDKASNYEIYSDTNEDGETTYYILKDVTMKKLDLPESVSGIVASNGYFTYNSISYNASGEVAKKVYCNTDGQTIYSVEISSEEYRSHEVNACGNILIFTLRIKEDGAIVTKYYIAK